MQELNLTDGDLTHRQEIVQLLKMSIEQGWKFSYVTKIRNRVTTHSLRLVSLNVQDGTFCVESDSMDRESLGDRTIMFRGQSGGVSIVFQSTMTEGDASGNGGSSLYDFGLPYKIACTQLRKTARINLERDSDVPVTLYLTTGAMIEGTVMDMSTSGAKFRVNENLGNELKNLQIVDACKIVLSEELVLQCGVQLIGMINDEGANISFLRSQFVHMKSEDEDKLESFINTELERQDSDASVLA